MGLRGWRLQRRFLLVCWLSSVPMILGGCAARVTTLPGAAYVGPVAVPTSVNKELQANLRRHVQALAGDIGERNRARPQAYRRAEEYIIASFQRAGYSPKLLQERRIGEGSVHNVEVELPGTERPGEFLVIGAHFDSEKDCPGGNDNASGVAALLELARFYAGHPLGRTVRFVAFYDEENFSGRSMGSRCYAADARKRQDHIVGMLSLETIGYYTDAPKSQHYPLLFKAFYPAFPTTANFVGFVGNRASGGLVRQALGSFRAHSTFPSEGAVAPWFVADAGRSDHVSFWQEGYPALMVTDTAEFRYQYYHEPEDTPEKLDYERTAKVVAGLVEVVRDLAGHGRTE